MAQKLAEYRPTMAKSTRIGRISAPGATCRQLLRNISATFGQCRSSPGSLRVPFLRRAASNCAEFSGHIFVMTCLASTRARHTGRPSSPPSYPAQLCSSRVSATTPYDPKLPDSPLRDKVGGDGPIRASNMGRGGAKGGALRPPRGNVVLRRARSRAKRVVLELGEKRPHPHLRGPGTPRRTPTVGPGHGRAPRRQPSRMRNKGRRGTRSDRPKPSPKPLER